MDLHTIDEECVALKTHRSQTRFSKASPWSKLPCEGQPNAAETMEDALSLPPHTPFPSSLAGPDDAPRPGGALPNGAAGA
eukprot:356173-Chlamydomonas_euryale.AAC.3